MIKSTNVIVKGKWKDYFLSLKEKKELYSYENRMTTINGYKDKCFFYNYGLYHIFAKDEEHRYDIKFLDIIDNRFSIVAVICFENCEEVEMFDENGLSRSGKYQLEIEVIRFEIGDYVKTDMGAIGILCSGEWLQCGIWDDGREYITGNSCGIPIELCTKEEVEKINELLFVNDMKFNEITKTIEKI